MNEKEIVDYMIGFVERKERELQLSKMGAESQIKNDVVRMILDELERVTDNED